MDSIKETLFGEKKALSATILALKSGKHISQARNDLEAFYQTYKERLSAAYLVSEVNNSRRVFRLQYATDISKNAQIYCISPSNALDPVVLAELDHEKQLLAAALSKEQLLQTGRILNPLVVSGTAARSEPEEPFNKKQKLEAPQVAPASEAADVSMEDEDIILPTSISKPSQVVHAQPAKPQSTAQPAQPAPAAAPKPAPTPVKPIKLAKIPSQPGKAKQQASLTSFFSKKT